MTLLGQRLRTRRRQLGYTQKDLATSTTGSFISRIERGHDLPSLHVLAELAAHLDSTSGELIGDLLVLEAAKLSVLIPQKCRVYLNELPSTSITQYLARLTTSIQKREPIPEPPQDPEMHFLAALGHIKQADVHLACRLIQDGLQIAKPKPLTRNRLELLLGRLRHPNHTLLETLAMVDHMKNSAAVLPPPELLTFEDIVMGLFLQFEALH